MTAQDNAPFTPRPEGPDFIGIGVPRSGTTWLAECLAQHPQVYIHTKEIAFFTRHFYKGYGWYHKFFRDKGPRFAGDMTPSYFITPRDSSWKKEFYPHINPRRALLFWQRTPAVRDEIVRKYPGIKVFVLFRDPADRAWSHYWKWRDRKDKLGKRAVPFEKMFEEDGRWLRSTGYYDLYLERWRSIFPDMGIFFFDDLKADGMAFFRNFARFLGIDDSFTPSVEGAVNVGKYNPLPKETRQMMVETYRPNVDRLSVMVGRDLSGWLKS